MIERLSLRTWNPTGTHSATYPQQNGVAERANQTLTECMHAMMKDQDCPLALWGEAICTATYSLNHTPISANGGVTPIQAFDGTAPDVSHMQVFYSDAYIHHSKSSGAKKLGDHATHVNFVRYPDGVSGHRFWNPDGYMQSPTPDTPIDTPPSNGELTELSDAEDNPAQSATGVHQDAGPAPDLQPPHLPPSIPLPAPHLPAPTADHPTWILQDHSHIHTCPLTT